MFGSVRRSRGALACLLMIGAISAGCSSAASPTNGPVNQPPNYQPPQVVRPATAAPATAAPPAYPAASSAAATAAPGWPQPRWTPVPGYTWSTPAPTVPGGNTFQDPGVNPFENPNQDPFSTFAMDVDTASYAVARRYIETGSLPERDSVRLEEYVNSFDYGYTQPTNGAFAINLDGAPSPFVNSGTMLLRVGLQARSVAAQLRPPAALTFVIDTSGSMADGGRLETVKHSLALLVGQLRPQDSIAVVQFSDTASVVVPPTSAANSGQILAALQGLTPTGSTNAQAGLELGFELASGMLQPGGTDRVIIASDGVANVGLTDANSLLARIDSAVQSGIDLVSIGVGLGNFNDALLEQLADRGNGFYAYINDQTEADKVFGTQLTGTLDTVAREARVQVEFNPAAVAAYRLLGYENRTMSAPDFNNPNADAGEVGAGHSVTALYEIQPTWGPDTTLGQVSLHWIDPDTGARQAASADITTSDFAPTFDQASPSFRLAATVGAFAELLRHSPYATGYSLSDVASAATSLMSQFDAQTDVADFAHLAQQAAQLNGQPINAW